jgi:Fe-S cluster assembly protein SufD
LSTAARLPTQYLESFSDFERFAAGKELPWLQKVRRDAFARFCEIGFPSTHDEDWRFTNVSAIANTDFRLARGGREVSPEQLQQFHIEGACCRLVFVDGHFSPALSLWPKVPQSFKGTGVALELATCSRTLEQHYTNANSLRDGFSALNLAFAEDGAFVQVPRGVVLEAPIYLLFVSTPDTAPVMSNIRNVIVAAENSQFTIVEEYVALHADGSSATPLCNAVTELVAGEGAVVSHYMIERDYPNKPNSGLLGTPAHGGAYNISTLNIEQGRSANVASHSLLLGGALVRNNVHPVLAGEGGECLINGLFLGTGTEHLDNYMQVEHAAPHCSSRQFYNGILDGRAHGVFHGRIIVRQDAQKTDAKQTNRNLLLSDDAQIDTKPQLEIHADDVKCTHGATIGQIDEAALFYLRSRGISEALARKLLLLAFAEECIERMHAGAARDHVEHIVRQYVLHITGNAPEAFLHDSLADAVA